MICMDGFPVEPGGKVLLIARGVVDVIMLLLILLGNSFIIFAILRHRRRQKVSSQMSFAGHVSSRFVLNLAAADIMVAISTTYYISFNYLCPVEEKLGAQFIPCIFRFIFVAQSHAASGYSLVAIAIDRYVAVVHALRYREIMTNRVCIALVASAWILSYSAASIFFYWNYWTPSVSCVEEEVVPTMVVYVITLVHHCIVMGVVVGVHIRIHREAMSSNGKHRESRVKFATSNSNENLNINTKSARVLILVTCCYVTSWSPLITVQMLRLGGVQGPYLDMAYRMSFSFINVNYLVNPFLYSWKNAAVRTAILKVINSCFRRKSPKISDLNIISGKIIHKHKFSPMLNICGPS